MSPNPLPPPAIGALEAATRDARFGMASDRWTGALLRTLAASKPRGRLLEIGTGTGLATAWLLDGMDADARLVTIDNDEAVLAIARRFLAQDGRVRFVLADGGAILRGLAAEQETFDLIFADAWPGKYDDLPAALALLAPGGMYVVDDLLPQPNWPERHGERVDRLMAALMARSDLHLTRLDWSTGLAVAARYR